MKKFVILFAFVAFACAAPISEDIEENKEPAIAILSQDRNQAEDGSYNFVYEGADGSSRDESARIANEGTDDEAIEITGSYKYIDSNGEEVVVNYTAGKNGFVPVSSIIPKEITEVADQAKNLPKHSRNEEYENENDGPEGNLQAPRRQGN